MLHPCFGKDFIDQGSTLYIHLKQTQALCRGKLYHMGLAAKAGIRD